MKFFLENRKYDLKKLEPDSTSPKWGSSILSYFSGSILSFGGNIVNKSRFSSFDSIYACSTYFVQIELLENMGGTAKIDRYIILTNMGKSFRILWGICRGVPVQSILFSDAQRRSLGPLLTEWIDYKQH